MFGVFCFIPQRSLGYLQSQETLTEVKSVSVKSPGYKDFVSYLVNRAKQEHVEAWDSFLFKAFANAEVYILCVHGDTSIIFKDNF